MWARILGEMGIMTTIMQIMSIFWFIQIELNCGFSSEAFYLETCDLLKSPGNTSKWTVGNGTVVLGVLWGNMNEKKYNDVKQESLERGMRMDLKVPFLRIYHPILTINKTLGKWSLKLK